MRVLIAVALAAALVGCGEKSDEEQVRDAARQLAEHGRDHRWGDFCAGTTEPDACTKTLAGLDALGVDVADYIPPEQAQDDMRITVNGDRAVVDSTEAENAEYARRDGKWLLVWEGN